MRYLPPSSQPERIVSGEAAQELERFRPQFLQHLSTTTHRTPADTIGRTKGEELMRWSSPNSDMTPQRRSAQSLGRKVVIPDSVMPMMMISRGASGMNRGRGRGTQSYQSSSAAPANHATVGRGRGMRSPTASCGL
jgi:hypothetical protein